MVNLISFIRGNAISDDLNVDGIEEDRKEIINPFEKRTLLFYSRDVSRLMHNGVDDEEPG